MQLYFVLFFNEIIFIFYYIYITLTFNDYTFSRVTSFCVWKSYCFAHFMSPIYHLTPFNSVIREFYLTFSKYMLPSC